MNQSTKSLAALQKTLEDKLKEAADLAESQADNKRHQGSLKQAIDVIAKNLAEFQKDGEDLARQFGQLGTQADHKLNCVGEQLGDRLQLVKEALQELFEAHKLRQDELSADEQKLTGQMELVTRNAARTAERFKKHFEQLLMSELKKRISAAQALLREASAIADDSPADLAAAFVLASLAKERLHWTLLESDFVAEKVPFIFPKNYERELVDAYENMNEKAEGKVTAQEELKKSNEEFNQGFKDLVAARTSSKDDALSAARKAATCTAGKSSSKQ